MTANWVWTTEAGEKEMPAIISLRYKHWTDLSMEWVNMNLKTSNQTFVHGLVVLLLNPINTFNRASPGTSLINWKFYKFNLGLKPTIDLTMSILRTNVKNI